MTEVDDRNFTPEGTSNKHWKELEAAEKKQEQSRQNSDGSGNDEQKFAPYFADANRQIDELESEASGKKSQIDSDLLNSKIEIVKDLAQKIEKAGFPVKGIANEIVHQLKGKISPTYIRRNLDDKYKDGSQSNNAKKQKLATLVSPTKQLPKQQVTVGVDGHETTDTCSKDLPIDPSRRVKANAKGDSEDLPLDPPSNQDISVKSTEDLVKKSPQSQQQDIQPITTQQQSQPPQQQIRVLIDWDELQDKMTEVHHKDIKSFWLCGRIENGTDRLLNMVLKREQQPLQVMANDN